MVFQLLAEASAGVAIPAVVTDVASSLVGSAVKSVATSAAKAVIGGAATKIGGAVTGTASKIISAKAAAVSGLGTTLLKATPVLGPATVGAGKLAATIGVAMSAATAVIGVGKISMLPVLMASLVYYNYDFFDPENRPFNVKQVDSDYDFIIVGGGAAGSVLANRLSEIPHWKVLLLEAGGHETEVSDVPILSLYLHKSKLDWKYRTQPQSTACQAMKDNRCCWTRGKVIGGSSVLNTMLYVRGNRRDYDQWEAFGNPGWAYEDILPYFRKSEDQRNPYLATNTRYHGTGGLLTVQDSPYNTPLGMAFLQAGEEMGYDIVDINGEQQTGFAFYQFTMRRGSRCSDAKAFIRPVRLRKNLHIALFAHVTKIIFDPDTKRALGVEFIRDGIKQATYAKREVILSAGAINSPHLLMLSGIGPRDDLQKVGIDVIHESPGVGRNLQDHIAIGGLAFKIDPKVAFLFNRMFNVNSAIRYALTEDGPLTSSIGLEVTSFINTKYANHSDDWPDMNLFFTSASTPSDPQVKVAHGLKPEFYEEIYKELENKDVYGIFPMILRPRSRGFIKIISKNPLRYPLLYHNYLTHPDDVHVMREGVKAAIAVSETQAMKQFGSRYHSKPLPNCKHLPHMTDEYWECVVKQYTMTIYHYSCTAQMGPPTNPYAVVDPQLRVYGVSGLRVIDASIMPTIPSGNIHAPTVMVAEKGADLIKELWLQEEVVRSEAQAATSLANNQFNIIPANPTAPYY